MERWNSEGIPRGHLAWALTQPHLVRDARHIDRCLLCRRPRVNEAGLCTVCHSLLDDRERALAQRWLMGVGP